MQFFREVRDCITLNENYYQRPNKVEKPVKIERQTGVIKKENWVLKSFTIAQWAHRNISVEVFGGCSDFGRQLSLAKHSLSGAISFNG